MGLFAIAVAIDTSPIDKKLTPIEVMTEYQ
jgi:hypothetical protein